MKRIKILAPALCLTLSGCMPQNGGNDVKTDDNYPSYYEYVYESQTLEGFTVSDDGRLIITKVDDLYSSDLTCEFIEYDMDGNSKSLCKTSLWPSCLAFMGDEFYISGSSGGKTPVIRFDLETGEYSVYAEIPLGSCWAMSGNKNELYLIGGDPEKEALLKEQPFRVEPASVYRVRGGEVEKINVDLPTAVCAKREGGAIIAACDENGCYITEYYNGGFSEKVYADNSKDFVSYSIIGELAEADDEHIVYTTYTSSRDFALCASSKKDMYIAELIPGKRITKNILSAGGYCFFQSPIPADGPVIETSGKHSIERIKFSDYYKFNDPLTLICSEYSGITPFGCGYTINMTKPSNEETALKILSQDKDYDLFYLNTRDSISYAIKSKGSFYPLNDIPGVREYIDKCFPSVKEAFTDENGDIWAIPLHANSMYIFSDTGENDYSAMTLKEFIGFIDGLSDGDMEKVSYTTFTYTEILMADYLTKYDSFDTPEFREAMELLKNSERLNMSGDKKYNNPTGKEKLMGMCFNDNMKLFGYSGEYKVSGTPVISSSNVLIPNVMFLSVNPGSLHLDDALDYISELVKYQSEAEDTFIFEYEKGNYSKSGTVKQMAELSANAEIFFTYPGEIYWNELEKYLADELSLDSFIKEADRKLKAYLNE